MILWKNMSVGHDIIISTLEAVGVLGKERV